MSTRVAATNLATFKAALDLADNAADGDRIFLGATTYVATAAAGFDYQSGPVEVSGQGAGETIVTNASAGADKVLRLIGRPGTYVHDLRRGAGGRRRA